MAHVTPACLWSLSPTRPPGGLIVGGLDWRSTFKWSAVTRRTALGRPGVPVTLSSSLEEVRYILDLATDSLGDQLVFEESQRNVLRALGFAPEGSRSTNTARLRLQALRARPAAPGWD